VAKKMFTEAGLERLRAPDKGRVEEWAIKERYLPRKA
jgi:hypothetical protein